MPLETKEFDIELEENPFVSRFQQFFETEYLKHIEKIVEKYSEKKSLEIDFKELEKFDFELADELLDNPDYLIQAAERAIQKIEIPSIAIQEFKPFIRFYNLPEDRHILLRNISAEHLNKLIAVEGVIKQITDVLPRLKTAIWKCNRCGNTYSIAQTKDSIKEPVLCECKHKDFSLVSEESVFIDSQKIQIQEPLEKLKGNEQPTTLDIIVTNDLVNRVSAGDRIIITGILRLHKTKKEGLVFSRILEAIHLEQTSKEFEEIEISEEEIEEIKRLAKDPAIYDKIIKSIAPSIYGHENVKEAVALQLFGGVKKILPDKQTIRGNIHVLLVGEPGVAKSQLLQAANNIAPKSIYVAGKTTSAVGLTATAVKDEFGEGGWTLKAGALVLASNGTVMADELDKMEAEDRTALHEAMEQGMISVAKAGIITRFKTETSILAAANPKYSRFEKTENVMKQIDLPATLISRFDLFFIIKDVLDKQKDEKIAEHILRTHQAGQKLRQHISGEKKLKEKELKEIEERVKPEIEPELLKKYISFARQNVFPVLTEEALQEITSFYISLREKGREEEVYTATHRQLEGLVRLSEASARVRLSNEIERQDALRAIRLVKTSLEEVIRDPQTGKLDIDYITTGQPQSDREKIKTILRIIKDKALEVDAVPIDEVLKEALDSGIEKDEARELIRKLIVRGDLYSPHHNTIKPTTKE